MCDVLTIAFEVVVGVWLLNVFIEGLFDIDVISIIVKKFKKWANDVDDPA